MFKNIVVVIKIIYLINNSINAVPVQVVGKVLGVLEDIVKDVGEFGDKYEGDIIITSLQRRSLEGSRNGLLGATKRWPGNVVVYYIEEDDFDDKQVAMIEEGMTDIANKSCLKFRKRNNKNEHAVIIQGSANGCFSNVGFNSNPNDEDDDEPNQVLNLSKGCFRHGTVVHEMLHTIGFYHMQSTHNRDDYVKINWENIKPGMEHNFAKYSNDTVTDFGIRYDYGSVMHYPETAFSKNGNKTLVPLQDNVVIGQRDGLSESDVLKLNKMYCDCSSKGAISKNLYIV